ncbi:MAG: 2,3-bisphosphoglycerate-independent phosphoglycerate mutase [bacterium]
MLILDGFGITPEVTGNAVLNAKTPNIDLMVENFPNCLLKASAEEVGLPWGEFGSSEVGHTTIGMGRIVLQDLPQITKSITDGSIAKKSKLIKILNLVDHGSKVHLLFLMSNGGVHGHIKHLLGLVKIIKSLRPKAEIVLHIICDGRDVGEKSANLFLDQIKKEVGKLITFGSIMGRFYAMDRDKNWDRTQAAYDAITRKENSIVKPEDIIADSYKTGKTDEFFDPVSLGGKVFDPVKDVMIFTNYRSDRAVQITRAFVDKSLKEIKRTSLCQNFFSMTTYDDNLGLNVLFSNIELNNPETNSLTLPISEIISKNSLSQLHIAETEKFAHITYFFSGGNRTKFHLEEDILIPSKKLASYDVFPQMRVIEISNEIIKASSKGYNFIAANFANGDMVGHSGNFEATKKALTILDNSLGKCVGALLHNDYDVFITSDHGNCDEMVDFASGKPNKEHSLSPVPFINCSLKRKKKLINKEHFFNQDPIGILADIAPTVLDSLGISKPKEMTGINLKSMMS